ncbi:MAG: isochorismatase, partial [Chloroflexi bacterium]|nr:isochorismatase [Chloroflexota bacterium]
GEEVYRLVQAQGIELVLSAGVHTNMCILGRSFGIRQLVRWGVKCALVRDLTDTMYNPRMAPRVAHEQGTRLVIEHIEQYWCPTILSADLLKAAG